ncbi:GD14978 [Drosophila simulans]|uniref:GD14978 n=1 Tax=Drosophila simulans TaxID=7240 RepID=B4QK74_DROSI|nr:GD14978 [Drosophila simulans]
MEELCNNSGHSATSSSGSNSSISAKTALSECSAAWINYLSALNNLCTAGSKLAHSIAVLEQWSLSEKPLFNNYTTTYLTNSWNDLARATTVATGTVKTHMLALLQDFVTMSSLDQTSSTDLDQKRFREHNELIVLENAQAVINIQHQFCAASYDAFSSLTCCFVCQSPVGFPHEQDCSVMKQRRPAQRYLASTELLRCQSYAGHFRAHTRSLAKPRPIAVHEDSISPERQVVLKFSIISPERSASMVGSSCCRGDRWHLHGSRKPDEKVVNAMGSI